VSPSTERPGTLDALVCGWVVTRYLTDQCRAYGNYTAAIWIPTVDGEQRGA
jgi:hypothetical protein